MRVLFHQHLFDENPKEYNVEAKTFGELLQKTGIKGHVVIYDWGDRLEYPACHDLQPKAQTIRIIRVPENKATKAIGGAVGIIAGVVLSFVGMPLLGAALVMAGTSLLGAAFIKTPESPATPNLPEYIDGYNLYGGSNPSAIGKVPPVVIGKHKLLPPVVGTGITRIQPGAVSPWPRVWGRNDSGGFTATQHVKFMYCLGYITDDTLVTDIKLGGSLFCSNKEGIRNGQLVIDGNFAGTAELRQDGQLPDMYQQSIKETQINSEIKVMSDDYAKAFFTTQPNTIAINISVYASGLYVQNDDGSIGWTAVDMVVYYRAAGETNWATLGNISAAGNRNQLWRKQQSFEIPEQSISNNPGGIWEILVCKTSGESGTKYANRIILSSIQSVTTEVPVSGKIAGKLTYLCCEFQAAENNVQALKNLTCVVQNAIPVWNGNDWNTSAFTSNPAAWYRWVLKSPALSKNAPDNRITDLETLYEWCEAESRTVNAVISAPLQIRDLLNNILSTSQAQFTLKNGLYSYSHDRTRVNPVALITPKNSSEFSITKNFAETVDAIDATFNDEASDWEEITQTILPYGATEYTNATQIKLWGTTNYDQAVWIARYLLACNIQRTESYKLKIGIEHYSIPRGERVIIQQDVLSVGVCSGRIISVDPLPLWYAWRSEGSLPFVRYTGSEHPRVGDPMYSYNATTQTVSRYRDIISVGDGYVVVQGDVVFRRYATDDIPSDKTLLTIDETVEPQGAESFGVKVFMQDGTIRTINVISQSEVSNTLKIEQADADGILAGDLYAYGPTGMEVLDCVVQDKILDENGGCELTLIPYDESIFEATDKPVPAYNPKIYGAGMSWSLPQEETPVALDTIQTPHQGNVYYDFAEYTHDTAENAFVNRGTLRELSAVQKPIEVFDYENTVDEKRGLNVCWATPNANMTTPVSFFVDNAFWKSTSITFMSKGFTLSQNKKVFMSYNDVESQNTFSMYSENGNMYIDSQGAIIDVSAVDWVNPHHIIITRNWDTFIINVYEDMELKVSGSFVRNTAVITSEGTTGTPAVIAYAWGNIGQVCTLSATPSVGDEVYWTPSGGSTELTKIGNVTYITSDYSLMRCDGIGQGVDFDRASSYDVELQPAVPGSQEVLTNEDGVNIITAEGAGVLRSALNRNILFYLFGDNNGLGLTDCTIGDLHIYDWELADDYISNLYTNGILLLSVDKLSRYLGEFMGVPPFVRLGDSFKWINTTTDTFQNGKIYWLTPSGWALLNGNAEAATQGS